MIQFHDPSSAAIFWLVLIIGENTWACDPIIINNLVSGQLLKTCDLDEFYTGACDMVMWCWSADALFWQLSIDHGMDLQYDSEPRWTCKPNRSFGQQARNGRHVVQLRTLTACAREQMPLTRMTMKNFLLLCIIFFGLSNFYKYGASLPRPFRPPKLRYDYRKRNPWFIPVAHSKAVFEFVAAPVRQNTQDVAQRFKMTCCCI